MFIDFMDFFLPLAPSSLSVWLMTNFAFFFKDFFAQGKEVPKFLKYTGAFDEKLLGTTNQ